MMKSSMGLVIGNLALYFLAAFHLAPAWSGESPTLYNETPIIFEDEAKNSVTLNQWQNEDVILAFGYTSCRITCPQVIGQLKRVQAIMDKKSIKGEILFVSIDPENDTAEKLAHFKKDHKISSTRWHFLRGPADDTKKLAKALAYGYVTTDEHLWHDRKVFVIGKDGRVRTTLNGFDADLSQLF